MDDFQRKYLTEAGLRIQYEGVTVCEEKEGLLPVEWAGSRVCNVNGNGGMTYLAGHQTQYGVQFITWDRLQDGTLWQGHYFNPGEGMDAAKRDFTTRSGLIPAVLLFTREQLAVIFDAAQIRRDAAILISHEPEPAIRIAGPFFIVHGEKETCGSV